MRPWKSWTSRCPNFFACAGSIILEEYEHALKRGATIYAELKGGGMSADAYHMTRARRQFALNGIHTLPIPAPLPMQKGWLQPQNNAQHSRRTLYELAAYARDVFAPQDNCRQASEVSFETLLRSRKPENVKTF